MASEGRLSLGRSAVAVVAVIVLVVSAVSAWKGAELNKLLREGGMLPIDYLVYSRTGAVSKNPKSQAALGEAENSGRDPDPFATAEVEPQNGGDSVYHDESMGLDVNPEVIGEHIGSLQNESLDETENATTGARLTEEMAKKRITQLQGFLGSLQVCISSSLA